MTKCLVICFANLIPNGDYLLLASVSIWIVSLAKHTVKKI